MRIPSVPPRAAPVPEGPLYSIGNVPWTREQAIAGLAAFLTVFERRPIRDNQGGMRSVGLFNVWFLLRQIRPAFVLESGIWKGQSTWLIEDTLPSAHILSLDIDLGIREYVSPRAQYSQIDFLQRDMADQGGRLAGGLAFFDDHQDVVPRLRKCLELGIKHVILDDNYPEFSGNRHVSAAACLNDRIPGRDRADGQPRFPAEREFLLRNLAAYHICPPVFDHPEPVTMEKSHITVPSLLGSYDPMRHGQYATYHAHLPEYRWTTYLHLK